MKPTDTMARCVVPVRATQAARWPVGMRAERSLAAPVGVAMLLHAAICAIVLAGVHRPSLSKSRDERTVALVFVAPTEPSAETAVSPAAGGDVTEPSAVVPISGRWIAAAQDSAAAARGGGGDGRGCARC